MIKLLIDEKIKEIKPGEDLWFVQFYDIDYDENPEDMLSPKIEKKAYAICTSIYPDNRIIYHIAVSRYCDKVSFWEERNNGVLVPVCDPWDDTDEWGDFEIDENYPTNVLCFWSKEDAEIWIEKNVPKTLPFSLKEPAVYKIVNENGHHIIKKFAVSNIALCKNRLGFSAYGNHDSIFFTVEDIGKTIFLSLEEANKNIMEQFEITSDTLINKYVYIVKGKFVIQLFIRSVVSEDNCFKYEAINAEDKTLFLPCDEKGKTFFCTFEEAQKIANKM